VRAAVLGMRPFRAWLTAALVGLLLLMSGAPCIAFAGPSPGPAVAAPADPCHAGKAAQLPPACPQCACQIMGQPPAPSAEPRPRLSRAQIDLTTASLSGRLEAPPTPPPRPSMS
jgi:hypothetical protein